MGQNQDALTRITEVKGHVDSLRQRSELLCEELERRVNHSLDVGRRAVERARAAVDLPAQLRAHPTIAIGAILGMVASVLFSIFARRARKRRIALSTHHGGRGQRALIAELLDQSSRPVGRDVRQTLLVGATLFLGGVLIAHLAKRR